jgi:diguanylate cyclase (GGDEF)-like protein/PAS domain S-box-containing protein
MTTTDQAYPVIPGELVDVLENLSEAFYTLDKEWRFTYLNRRTEQYLQQSRGDLLGKLIWEAFPYLLGSTYETQLRRAVDQGRPLTFVVPDAPHNAWKEVHVYPCDKGLVVTFIDITERKRMEDAERENFTRFELVARATSDIIWDLDVKADHLWWSEGLRRVFGYDPDDFNHGLQSWVNHIHPHERDRVSNGFNEALAGQHERWCDEYRFRRKDHSYAYVRDSCVFVRDPSGAPTHAVGTIVDITDQKKTAAERLKNEARIRLQASLLDQAHDAISVTGVDARITFWNRGAQRLFGWAADEVCGKTKAELAIGTDTDFGEIYRTVLEHGEWTGEIAKRRKNGAEVMVASHLTLVRDDEGRPQSVLEIETDVTQRKQVEQQVLKLAFYDPLTQLPNRRLLLDRLGHALAACARTGRSGALLFLDLDNFKSLNDTLGHDKGDQLLKLVARRLQAQVPRASDTVARHGGDEFVIVLEELSGNEDAAGAAAEVVAEKILHVFETPFELGEHQVHSSASVGVALFDRRVTDTDEMLKRADLAMYQAKASGRNVIRFFDQRMQTLIEARVKLEGELRTGLQREQFCLHYQRQADDTGHTVGAEALVRWSHPSHKLVFPSMFIPLAEETGLILRLGQWVIETACKQLVAWAADPRTAGVTLAVNVSARQFRHPTFVDSVLEIVEQTGVCPARLKLELTESLLVENFEHTIDNMKALKARGISFALDDFGTGYSSLAYLKRLPLDQLKIDQSFVRDVLTDPNDAAIARTILGLGQTLGMDVIAEGVETQMQRDFLAEHGCRTFQGYFFGTPVAADEF